LSCIPISKPGTDSDDKFFSRDRNAVRWMFVL